MTDRIEYSLGELADLLGVACSGDPGVRLGSLATLENAEPGQLSFFHNARYARDLLVTRASAVILHPDQAGKCPTHCLLSEQPYITFARASQLFEQRHKPQPGVHSTAVVDPTASIAETATIGPHAVIGLETVIAPQVEVGAGCYVGDDCYIGAGSLLHPRVTLYDGVTIGQRAVVHSGVVIGGDGFGFARDGAEHVKIAQLGSVRIGDDVEIGAGACIDRGALDDTVIGSGVKIDNLVQIAHNVQVGDNTVICGCSAIAGSSRVGKNCTIAGGVGIINHLEIADGVTVTAMSLVSQSIEKAGVYSSGTGLSDSSSWRKNAVRFAQLDEMARKLRRLEQALSKKFTQK